MVDCSEVWLENMSNLAWQAEVADMLTAGRMNITVQADGRIAITTPPHLLRRERDSALSPDCFMELLLPQASYDCVIGSLERT